MPKEFFPHNEWLVTFKPFELVKLILDLPLPEHLISDTLQHYPMPGDPVRSEN